MGAKPTTGFMTEQDESDDEEKSFEELAEEVLEENAESYRIMGKA